MLLPILSPSSGDSWSSKCCWLLLFKEMVPYGWSQDTIYYSKAPLPRLHCTITGSNPANCFVGRLYFWGVLMAFRYVHGQTNVPLLFLYNAFASFPLQMYYLAKRQLCDRFQNYSSEQYQMPFTQTTAWVTPPSVTQGNYNSLMLWPVAEMSVLSEDIKKKKEGRKKKKLRASLIEISGDNKHRRRMCNCSHGPAHQLGCQEGSHSLWAAH